MVGRHPRPERAGPAGCGEEVEDNVAAIPKAQKSDAWYRGAEVPMRAIRRYARQVAERFQPDRIILFGSHAYGTPHADSDVDILVIMPCRNQLDQACRIDDEVVPDFPLDLIVRTPKRLALWQAEGDSFSLEIVNKGKVLYEKHHRSVGRQSRSRSSIRKGRSSN